MRCATIGLPDLRARLTVACHLVGARFGKES